MKRPNRTVSPGGTITFRVLDVRGQIVETYVGTDDAGATPTDPTGGGLDPNNNMVLVTANQYDHGQDGGDGNLTEVTDHVDGSTTRVTNYVYDWLHRLHSAERGELNSGHASITSPQFGQCWTLDPTGNWYGFRQDDDGNSTWDLIQARTSNPVNLITDIDNTTGSSWATPSYDANGNMTTIPRPDLGTDRAMTATWDAWKRLTKLVDPDTSDTLAEFAYDGRKMACR